jgi:hypothetical protein
MYMTSGYGIHGWLQFAANQGPISANWMGNLQNSSLYGLVARVLTPFTPDTVAVLPKFKAIAIIISIMLVSLSVWVCWGPTKRAKETDPSAIDLPFVLFSLLSAYLNSWAWEHYFCLIIQPMFVLLAVYWRSFHATLREFCDNACSARKLLTSRPFRLSRSACSSFWLACSASTTGPASSSRFYVEQVPFAVLLTAAACDPSSDIQSVDHRDRALLRGAAALVAAQARRTIGPAKHVACSARSRFSPRSAGEPTSHARILERRCMPVVVSSDTPLISFAIFFNAQNKLVSGGSEAIERSP